MTSFEDIYELTALIMESEEIRQAPLYKKYGILNGFLQFAIAGFNTRCYRDLKTVKPFQCKSYRIVGDGLEREFYISFPFSKYTKAYIEKQSANGSTIYVPVESSTYSIDIDNSSIKFISAPAIDRVLNIYVYDIGYFYDELDTEEKIILSNGIVLAFYQNQLNRTTLLNQQVYGVGAKMHSQAEHIKRVSELLKEAQYEWTTSINAYTYEKSPDLVLNKSKTQKEILKDYRLEG